MSFAPFDFAAPLDEQALLAAIPEGCVARGFFAAFLATRMTEVGHATAPLDPLRDYPLRELLSMSLRAATILHPECPRREGLRRIGRLSFPALLASPLGRILFGFSVRRPKLALRLAPLGVRLSMNRGRAQVTEHGERHLVIAFADFWSAPELTFGGIEALLEDDSRDVTVLWRPREAAAFELDVRWSARRGALNGDRGSGRYRAGSPNVEHAQSRCT